MKYNQPYGMPEEDVLYSVPFVNGDPSIARAGSIPPAESIEYDQREIIAVIQWAYDHGYRDYAAQLCQAPTNADLTQLLKAIFGIMNSRMLQAPREYWVNGVTGDDANDGSSSTKAFKTLQKAQNTLVRFNLNGFNVTVNVAPATYAPLVCGSIGGSGSVIWEGDPATPSNCTVASPQGPAIAVVGVGDYHFNGFKLQSASNGPGIVGDGIETWGPSTVTLWSVDFGFCFDNHMYAYNGSLLGVMGPIRISGNAPRCHAEGASGGRVIHHSLNKPNLTIAVPCSMIAWALFGTTSQGWFFYNSITGFANVTGKKYDASMNSIIVTGGAGGNYLPGTVAGTTSSGGQYV
ncbi:hypothetical protein I6F35_22395 [Bradyrhizobium sp. BRP22]|uniref:hypothetical protein n=1 Tax=Bradyrhizobium sp. BRP22 TaxID=2793821 RepID=UPI001CD35BBC|nr:hypothetical protein [Bradyrhizobium sp. BRP22]MCA1455920.1 hypothetical protein [Bradyrhizobium sp. BRP22]